MKELLREEILMKIGIAYDTRDMYNTKDGVYYDFAEKQSIFSLKKELEDLNYEVVLLGNAYNIMELIKQNQLHCDIVYNTVEGISSRNREGIIPALLELNHIPYIGTDAFGLSLTLNKYLTKVIANYCKIKTPDCCLMRYPCIDNNSWEMLRKLHFPVIIKPNYEGNSSGICVCQDIDEALVQINYLFSQYQTDILCEQFIFGKEITVPYIDNTPAIWDVTTVDVQKTDDFWLDLNWKLNGDYQNTILELDSATRAKFEYTITSLFKTIGCHDFCRFDFRLTANNDIYFIEANPLPALFKGGSFDVVGQKNGYTYGETLQLIIQTACKRLSIPKI